MNVIAGSYERFIWGYKLNPSGDDPPRDPHSRGLAQVFSYPSHLAPVTTVAAAGPIAVSGSSDDTIHVYDMVSATSIGSLHHHSSTITSLAFFMPPSMSFPRNLISADEDGSVCISETDPFVHLKTISAHKKAVTDLSLHPSGRLALTVGRDSCLAMLNLVRGRRSFYCRLDKEADLIRFNLTGEKFFMVTRDKVEVHDAEDARVVAEFHGSKPFLCAVPGENHLLFTGGEDHNITAWDTSSGKIACSINDAHSARIKGIAVLKNHGTDADCSHLLASASSDGVIRVWDVRTGMKEKPDPLAEAATSSRLTCIAASSSPVVNFSSRLSRR